MAKQHLKSLQEALNSLVKGNHAVILNSTVVKVLPTAISHIALNNKKTTFEALLSQLARAAHAADPKLKVAAVSCLIATAKQLAGGAHWEQLKKIVPSLKLIVQRKDVAEPKRKEASDIISSLESVTSGKKTKAVKSVPGKMPVENEEEQIFKIAESGEMGLAKKKLIKLVITCAGKRDFFNAERLRDRIYEVDSMAVTEIIQLNKLIDEEKNKSIGKHELVKWEDLREKMTEDEFSRLFYAMEVKTFKPGTPIVSEGEKNDELYFINMGIVSVSYGKGERVFRTLETGDIFGENFFDSSLWTVSLTALELTRVLVLKRKIYDQLEKIIPELEPTLQGFYQSSNDTRKLIHLKKIERRRHERFTLDRGIQVQISGSRDSKPTHFRAALKDMSQGGLSFGLRITNRKNIPLLLSRRATIGVPPAGGKTSKFLRGSIVAVRVQDSITGDCSVHVKFLKEIDYETFKNFLY